MSTNPSVTRTTANDRLAAEAAPETEPETREAKKAAEPLLPKRKYKSIPEDWKALPEGRYLEVISHLEAVLLDISTDGKTTGTPSAGGPSPLKLRRWADHLRTALKHLTK